MSVSLDSVRITQIVLTQSITTLVTVYQASRTSTALQILMNVNQTLVNIVQTAQIWLMTTTVPACQDSQVTYMQAIALTESVACRL